MILNAAILSVTTQFPRLLNFFTGFVFYKHKEHFPRKLTMTDVKYKHMKKVLTTNCVYFNS